MNHFEEAWKRTGLSEGGYAYDPDDSGGETNWGITKRVARENGYAGMMKDLSHEKAEEIAKSEYWNPLNLDHISELHPELAHEIFDTGFNMGQGRAAVFFQRCLNVFNTRGADYTDIVVDGDIGPGTLLALSSLYNVRGKAGKIVMLRAMNSLQGAGYIELAERREKDEKYVRGWFLNRVVI